MSFLRARATANLLRTSQNSGLSAIIRPVTAVPRCVQVRHESGAASLSAGGSNGAPSHAVSAPMLADIEKRWEGMAPQEQAELWMALRDRMKGPWANMTVAERKASYWIAFGPHGPRALPPPGQNMWVFKMTLVSIAVSAVLFAAVRAVARPAPKTMSKEWQEASNEYLKNQKTEPISGVSSEGYTGTGMVQSKSKPYN